jgi:hypothetical protein
MIEVFEEKMITVYGFTPEEARMVVHGELQREYDQRGEARRSQTRLID